MRKLLGILAFTAVVAGASAQFNFARGAGAIEGDGGPHYFALNLFGRGERTFGFVAFATGHEMDSIGIFAFTTEGAWDDDNVTFRGMGVMVQSGEWMPVTIVGRAADGGEDGEDAFAIAAIDEDGNDVFSSAGPVVEGGIVIGSRG